MTDVPRQKLQYIITHFGREICDDPKRCKAMLCDLCPEYKREINVLIDALQENVVNDLLSTSSSIPSKVTIDRLTQRLYDHRGITEDIALWAVESWSIALGIITEDHAKIFPPFPKKVPPVSSGITHPSAKTSAPTPSKSSSSHSPISTVSPTPVIIPVHSGTKSIKDSLKQENIELSAFAIGVAFSLIIDLQGKLPSFVFYICLFIAPMLGFSLSKRFHRKWGMKLLLYYAIFHSCTLISYMLNFRSVANGFLYANFLIGIFLAIINVVYRIIR